MNAIHSVSRRRFLQTGTAAGGLVIGFHIAGGSRIAAASAAKGAPVNAWLKVGADDIITIYVPSSEMGQGVLSSMPALVAEELEVDWTKVRAEVATAAPVYNNRMFGMMGTGGSTSIRWSYVPLRQAGASAREMLKMAGARRWRVPVDKVVANNGTVALKGTKKRLSYGALAEAAAKLTPPKDVKLKPKSDWRLLGKPLTRFDIPPKVDGSAVFGVDVKAPGMLIGTVMASPVFGGKLKGFDKTAAMKVKGVSAVVPLPDALIVVGDGYWPAKKGLEAAKPQWDEGANAGASTASIMKNLKAGLLEKGALAEKKGKGAAALAGAQRKIVAEYEVPFLAHATMEPMNATVHVKKDGVEVWAPTQGQSLIQFIFAKMFKMKPEKIRVHTTFLGGGFGRRFEPDFVIQAALASKTTGRPVKLIWSREEDVRRDFYRPASAIRFEAGIDEKGRVETWIAKICCPSIMTRILPKYVKNGVDPSSVEGAIHQPYDIANLETRYVMRETGIPVGFWRAVGNSQNAFFVQSFVDELAYALKKDPVAFRLEMLGKSPRHKAVLEKAAKEAGWGRKLPKGHAQGVALHESFGSIVAQVVELSVPAGDDVKIHKVTCVTDCGTAINPDTIKAQMESGIIYGLTAALYGAMSIEKGRIVEGNFDSYAMLRLAQVPKIDVHIIESGAKIGGIGEPGTPPIGPAVANAIFQATGRRLRSLPVRKHDLTKT